ncbi:hypothetical protein VNI00_013973 [Paramarasmius palmivorus]|uniref:Uncharacterized protein n=1 Tax=Paramarasmius palmivorus TaxID=297713 RepID=A0AAW0BW32_9AGAR
MHGKMSYMRSRSYSPIQICSQESVETPAYSNQHWLSSFRQGLDGIDELDEEKDLEQEQGHEELPPISSSPTMDISEDLSDPFTFSSSPSDYSNYIETGEAYVPFKHKYEGYQDANQLFLEDIQERLTKVAKEREKSEANARVHTPISDVTRYTKKRPLATSSTQLARSRHPSFPEKRAKLSSLSQESFGDIHTENPRKETSGQNALSRKTSTPLTIDAICGVEPRGFATTTATARRALSIRSVDEEKENNLPVDWVPTVPCSPEAASVRPLELIPWKPPQDTTPLQKTETRSDADQDTDANKKANAETRPAVPIIAPPAGHTYTTPLSVPALARIRLTRLIEREAEVRKVDDLLHVVDLGLDWESFGIPEKIGENIVNWMLQVLPRSPYRSTNSTNSVPSPTAVPRTRSFSFFWEDSLSEYSPPELLKTSQERGFDNLIDQLKCSPETRWMGLWYLMRFLWCLTVKREDREDQEMDQEPVDLSDRLGVDEEDVDDALWDIAVGCLALSVKMQRDFLPPLYPVYSVVFEELPPACRGHGGVSYGELEFAQKRILRELDYSLGSSPQAVLDELWICVPALRDVISRVEWASVQVETWKILLEAARYPHVLAWPVSALAGVACVLGVEETLVKRWEGELPWWEVLELERLRVARNSRNEGLCATSNATALEQATETRMKRIRRAKADCEELVKDVKVVLNISDFRRCRKWLKGLRKAL